MKVHANQSTGTVQFHGSVPGGSFVGHEFDRRTALELAEAIREAAESLPDPPPDPWALLEEYDTHAPFVREWERKVDAALAWRSKNGGES